MATYFGFGPPFFGGQQNVLSRQEDERLIKNDVRGLLLTLPGERIYRADFGTKLRAFTFEQQSDDALEDLRTHIKEQIEKYEERVTVSNVSVVANETAYTVSVSVELVPNWQPLTKYLVEVKVRVPGG